MYAKEYLLQVKDLKNEVQRQKEYIQRLRDTLDVSAVRYDKENVQGSSDHDKFSKVFAEIEEKEHELQKTEETYVEKRLLIMNQINNLDDEKYRTILNKLYIDFKSLKTAGSEMNFCYEYIRSVHVLALSAFESKFLHKLG